MLRRRIIAVVTTLALALGMSVGGAGTAFANGGGGSELNDASYWKNLYPNAVECYKYDPPSTTNSHGTLQDGGVVLFEYNQSWPGDRWEVLIVKGGNGDNFGNAVYELPQAGVVYKTPTGQGVSHWIVCKGATPAQAEISITPASCDAAAALNPAGFTAVRAQFGTATYTPATGGQNFSITATAIDSSKFPIGEPGVNQARTTKTFTGFLPGQLTGDDCAPPPATMNITFMCKTVVDGVATNLAYAGDTTEWEAGTYIVRVRSDIAGVPFQVKRVNEVIYEGVSVEGDLFFGLSSPIDALTLYWQDKSKGTASTNETGCGFIPTETTADIAVIPADCLTGNSLNEAGFEYVVGESTYVITDGQDGQKVITFTAVLGYTFPGGVSTLEFTFTPEGPDLTKCGVTTADIDITPADCLTGSSLNENGFEYDSDESSYVITDGENGQKVITFTAKPGFLFADQQTTKVFTFTPTGPDFRDCELATASLTVPDPTCDAGQDWSQVTFDLSNATAEVTQVPSEENGYEYVVVYTAKSGAKFLVDGEYLDSIEETGTIDPLPNRDDCTLITAQIGFTTPTCDTGAQLDPTLFTSNPADSATFEIGMSDILGTYVVTATAKPGFTFAEGAQTQVFSGQLAGPDTTLCEEPTLAGSIATTACETDVPYILFSIELNDPDNQSTAGLEDAEIIFSGLDSEGNEREYVLGDLDGTVVDGVFSGKVLWPGAAVVDGQAAGWPGWELVDGEWTNVGDENFGWTRGLDSVTLSVNPTLEVELSYPPASPECATDPTVVDAFIEYSYDCLLGGTIELSDVDGVIWSINGEQTDQRVWTGQDIAFAPVFTASLDPEQPGLFFSPESITELTVEFELPESGCDLVTSPLVTPTLSSTQATCTTAGSYTLDAVEGVQWLVNGQVTAPGTYTATTGSTVEVEAVALQGFGFGFETQTEWTLNFPAPDAEDCPLLTDLPTLALTGASGMLGTVGIIALLITLTGIGAVVARRRVEA